MSSETKRSLREAYPLSEAFGTGTLDVGDGHTMFYAQFGNPQGKPAVYLHGGPGGGSSASYSRFFDPETYRIILYDQRGCGKSTPHASLDANTTPHLVADLELLREHLNIDRWLVAGGSWGSTLALVYAQKYPERVKALVLRGIFSLRRCELLWFYQEGASWLFPDCWEEFIAPIPELERFDLMGAYYRRLTGSDQEIRLACAKAWSRWEGATLSLYPNPARVEGFGSDNYALAFARIECHYFINGGFLQYDGQIIAEAGKLEGIPGTIVQGRYDVVTPVKSAWELHKAWPDSELKIIADAGHAAGEPGITSALVEATDKYKRF